jgi:hypothetical protein
MWRTCPAFGASSHVDRPAGRPRLLHRDPRHDRRAEPPVVLPPRLGVAHAHGVAHDVAHLRREDLAHLLLAELARGAVAQRAHLLLVRLHVELVRLRVAEVDRDGRLAVGEAGLRDVLRDDPGAHVAPVHLLQELLRLHGVGGGDADADVAGVELVGDLGVGHADAEALRLVAEQLTLDQPVDREALEVHLARQRGAARRHEQAVRGREVLRVDAAPADARDAGLAQRADLLRRARAEREDEREDRRHDDRAVDDVREPTLPEDVEHGWTQGRISRGACYVE